jgi:hypothetical protein
VAAALSSFLPVGAVDVSLPHDVDRRLREVDARDTLVYRRLHRLHQELDRRIGIADGLPQRCIVPVREEVAGGACERGSRGALLSCEPRRCSGGGTTRHHRRRDRPAVVPGVEGEGRSVRFNLPHDVRPRSRLITESPAIIGRARQRRYL